MDQSKREKEDSNFKKHKIVRKEIPLLDYYIFLPLHKC